MTRATTEALPLTRPFHAAQTPAEGVWVDIVATPQERAALARANGLLALESLEARLRVAPGAGGVLTVSGEVRALARRICVVTLEAFEETVEEPVQARFAPPREAPRRGAGREAPAETAVDLDDDPPEPIADGVIDLGALAAEFLTLGLDPYPRKPGAVFVEPSPGERRESPFAALRPPAKLGRDGGA